MKPYVIGRVVICIAVLTASAGEIRATRAGGELQVASEERKPRPAVPLKVDVVFSRFQGDKKLSNLPYTLWVNAVDQRVSGQQTTTLRMGVDVPIGTVSESRPSASGNNLVTTTTRNGPDFRNVGTSIDCWAFMTEENNRYAVGVRLSDSSIFTADQQGAAAIRTADPMAFRTFSTSNTITMRDGQTVQFATATDKITGETMRVEVTINTVK